MSATADSAHVDEWHGDDVSLDQVQQRLCEMRTTAGDPDLRTSVMTHTAWVPKQWIEAARGTLAGLAEAHPSRTIALVPEPDAGRDAIDATVSVYRFELSGEARRVYTEVVELHLCGARASSPASIVEPLLISDLPVFSRWRGRPAFERPEFDQLVGVVDRMIVDSAEWEDIAGRVRRAGQVLRPGGDLGYRVPPFPSLAGHCSPTSGPRLPNVKKVEVTGPRADALLIAGWLRSRLDRKIELEVVEADELSALSIDGDSVGSPRGDAPDPSQLLSDELEQFGRDRIYEAAVRAAA